MGSPFPAFWVELSSSLRTTGWGEARSVRWSNLWEGGVLLRVLFSFLHPELTRGWGTKTYF